MKPIQRLRSVVGDDQRTEVVECRRCGTTLDRPDDPCPYCGPTADVVVYDID